MTTNGSPIIVEPTTPPNHPLPNIPHLSPHASSSSDSFDSSQPNSPASSATSRSDLPSPAPKSVGEVDSQESIELATLPSNPPLPETTPASQSQHRNEPPRSVPSNSAASSTANRQTSWLWYFGCLVPRGNWVSNILGSLNFWLALIGMLVFGNLAVWTARNDAFTTCSQIIIAGKEIGPNCERITSKHPWDVESLPWGLGKRARIAILEMNSRLKINALTKRSDTPTTGSGGISDFSSTALVLASAVIVGGLSLIVFRRYWRTEEVFTSPVRVDWRFTRHPEAGPETVSEERYHMIKHNPEGSHTLDELRQRIRSSQPNAVDNPLGESRHNNSSEETLVGPWKDMKWASSKVSITNNDESSADEVKKHVNLIELETAGLNKTFFDPETGEFIHLTPWKSTRTGADDDDDEIHGLRPDGKGSIKRAFAQMTVGAIGWAGGKGIDDQLAEELQANSKGEKEKELEEQPKVGDCVTADMTNEAPSGKHTVA